MAALFETHVNLGDNEKREIDNPLSHISRLDDLDNDARQFARRINRTAPNEELFIKAARIARDPLGYSCRSIPNLTQVEYDILQQERQKGFWHQPKTLRVTIATLCLGAVLQGWTQTGGNGSNLSWPKEFGLKNANDDWEDSAAVWKFAAVNAVTYLSASIFGCWLSDPLQSWLLGRRGAIFVSGLLVLASVVGGACTQTWQGLLVTRVILGLGMGSKASVVPIFGAEVAPPHLRGALVMNWQLMTALGIFLGFTSNLIVAKIGPLSWRFQIASAVLPTICLLTLIWATPESPRFLMKKGRLAEAYESLLSLRESPIQAAREIYYANAQIQAEVSLLPPKVQDHEDLRRSTGYTSTVQRTSKDTSKLRRRAVETWRDISHYVPPEDLDSFQLRIRKTNYFTRLYQLFRDRRTRRATVAALCVMIGQQLCGVNVLAFYSSTFFEDVNNNAVDALWLSWGLGLANFIFTFPAYYFIDKRGRRFLLLATYPGMALSMLAACLSFLISDNHRSARNVVIALFIFIFFFFYSWGIGPVAFAYSSEIFPLLNREQGMSFAVFINLFGAGILTLFVPSLTTALQSGSFVGTGQSRLLAIFAGLNVLSFLLIFFFVPETAGATLGHESADSLNYISLEELNYIFGVSTRKHIHYQITHVLPWSLEWAKYWVLSTILRRPNLVEPEPLVELYSWVRIQESRKEGEQRSQEFEEVEWSDEDPGSDDIVAA